MVLKNKKCKSKTRCVGTRPSLNTFAFAFAAFTVLLAYVNKYHNLPIAAYAFFLLFSSMQLIEAGVWLTLNRKDGPDWNRVLSIIGFIAIALEPLVSLLRIQNSTLRNRLLLAYVIFALITCVSLIGSMDFRTLPAANGHLEWKWLSPVFESPIGWCIILIWLTFLIIPLLQSQAYLATAFLLGVFTLSIITFYRERTIGSIWCWIVNLVFVKILIDILFLQPCIAHFPHGFNYGKNKN